MPFFVISGKMLYINGHHFLLHSSAGNGFIIFFSYSRWSGNFWVESWSVASWQRSRKTICFALTPELCIHLGNLYGTAKHEKDSKHDLQRRNRPTHRLLSLDSSVTNVKEVTNRKRRTLRGMIYHRCPDSIVSMVLRQRSKVMLMALRRQPGGADLQ